MDTEEYCKMFIKTDMEQIQLYAFFVNVLHGEKDSKRTVVLDCSEIDVCQNKEYDSNKQNDFLYWKLYLDIQKLSDETDFDSFLKEIKQIKTVLSANGVETVIACSFEDLLKD